MHWICCLALLATAEPTASFVNGQGVHALKVVEGSLWHSLNAGPFGAVNDETSRAPGGNRITGVVAVCGSGFADLDDVHVAAARDLGIPIVISTDAHSTAGLDVMRYGVEQARRAGLEQKDVANTRTLAQFKKLLRK